MKRPYIPRTILIFCLAWMTSAGSPPGDPLDSLRQELEKHPGPDTFRLNLLNELAWLYGSRDSRKGLETAEEAVSLAKKLKNDRKLATAYSRKGMNYASLGKDSLALAMYGQALGIYRRLDSQMEMGKILHNTGLVHFGRSDYPAAIASHRKAHDLFEAAGDRVRTAYSLNSIGVNFMYLNDYPKALECYLEALKVFESAVPPVPRGRAEALNNIGITYKNLSEFDKAAGFYEQALEVHRDMGDRTGMARVLGNLGTVHHLRNDTAQALRCYREALAINRETENLRGIASDLSNIGIVHADAGRYEEALEYLEQASQLYRQLGDKNSLSIVLQQIGSVFSRAPDPILAGRGLRPSARFATALEYQTRSLQLARESGALDRQYEAWEHLSDTYAAQNNFGKAFDAYKQFIRLRDSVHTVENAKEITRKQLYYEFEKKEALAAAELRQQRTVKNAAMGGAAVLVLAAASGAALYKKRRDSEGMKKEAEFRALVSETEMKALRVQMNPHFIFNSLNAIADYMMKNNARVADEYLGKFAKLMRRVLEDSEQREVPLAHDLNTLELYMQLEALRLGHAFTYELLIDPEIDAENTLVPPLLMQPFVENSIRHGLPGRKEGGRIVISVKKEDEMIVCGIEDNGVGRKQAGAAAGPESGDEKRSMGIQITRSRINILARGKKQRASLRLRDLEEGTRVEIKLPHAMSF